MKMLFHEDNYLGKIDTNKDLTLKEFIEYLELDIDVIGEFEIITSSYDRGDILSYSDLTNEGIGLEYLITEETFDLEIGIHNEILHGSYSILLKGDTYLNIIFETNKPFKVIENEPNHVYKTIIDTKSIEVKITNLEII